MLPWPLKSIKGHTFESSIFVGENCNFVGHIILKFPKIKSNKNHRVQFSSIELLQKYDCSIQNIIFMSA